MNIKLAACCFVIAAIALPIAGFALAGGPRLPVSVSRDFLMTARIKAELAGENFSSLVRIKVRTSSNGVVTLGGSARSRNAAYRAASIARSVNGVSAVDNRIKIVVRN